MVDLRRGSPLPSDWGICESVVSSTSGVCGKVPAEDEFDVF